MKWQVFLPYLDEHSKHGKPVWFAFCILKFWVLGVVTDEMQLFKQNENFKSINFENNFSYPSFQAGLPNFFNCTSDQLS